jgi:DNA-binding MarR family transcriptional regulator
MAGTKTKKTETGKQPPQQMDTASGRVDRNALTIGFDLSRQDQSFSFRMRELTKLFARGLARDLRNFDVTLGQWQSLRALWEQDGHSQQELSSILNMTSAATVYSVNLLERDGLAFRQRDANDSRRFLIYLTPKGHALRKTLVPFARQIQIDAFADFSDDDIAMLDALLARMKVNLQNAIAERDHLEKSQERAGGKKRKSAKKKFETDFE